MANEIKKVTQDEAESIIATRQPLGKFYILDKASFPRRTVYVGIDNEDGDAWTEDFKTLKTCKKWLLGGDQ